MDHAASAQRFFDRITTGDIDQAIDVLGDDFVDHEQTPGLTAPREGVRQLSTMFQTAFPMARWEAEDVVVAGDTVVVRGRVNGTNAGELMGMPATDRGVSVQFIDILGFGDDGLIHEQWGVFDMMSMMQQLGVAAGAPA